MDSIIIKYILAILIVNAVLAFSGVVIKLLKNVNPLKLSRARQWLFGLGTITLLILIALVMLEFSESQGQPVDWNVGWIWPKQAPEALHMGLHVDGPSLVFSFLTLIAAIVYGVLSDPARLGVLPIFLGLLGVFISWFSMNAWTLLGGLFLAAWSGFFERRRWEGVYENKGLATQYLVNRFLGIGLAVLGSSLLLSEGSLADFSPELQKALLVKSLGIRGEAGVVLLWFGLFFQFQIFPVFLKETLQNEEGQKSLVDLTITRVFPAVCAYAGFSKAHLLFQHSHLADYFFFATAISIAFTVLIGLYRQDIKDGLSLAFSATMSLAAGINSLGLVQSNDAAFLIAIGSVLSLLFAFIFFNVIPGPRKSWKYLAVYFLMLGPGGIGFLGLFKALDQLKSQPVLLGISFLILLFISILQARWSWAYVQNKADLLIEGWKGSLFLVVAFVIQLAVFWVGHPLGVSIAGESQLFTGLMEGVYASLPLIPNEMKDPSLLMGILGVQLAGLAFGIWSESAKRSVWQAQQKKGGSWIRFIGLNLGTDQLGKQSVRALEWVGTKTTKIMDVKLWNEGLAWLDRTIVLKGGQILARVLIKPAEISNKVAFKVIDVPGKFLQLVQNGDVQWYLFFGLLALMAILGQILKR